VGQPNGRVIAGRYRLTRKLASGAMGAVWLAHDEVLNRAIAAKQMLLPPGTADDEAEQARQRVLHEARVAARICHANAITIFDVADDGGEPVLIMEYLSCRTLAHVLAERGHLSPAEVARIGAPVAAALAAAHAQGVVHRDVKPANILLADSPDGLVKLTDFGIAHVNGDVVGAAGPLIGSPAYVAPESIRGAEPTPAADVFSLGATLYRAVEGHLIYGDLAKRADVLQAAADHRIVPPRHAGPLTPLLRAMLTPDPAQRPTMREVHHRLRAVLAETTSSTPAPDQPDSAPARRPTRSRPRNRQPRTLVTTGSIVTIVLVFVLVMATMGFQPERKDVRAAGDGVSPTDRAAVATRFYHVLPRDTDTAWTMLTPRARATGRAEFDAYWDSVGSVTIIESADVAGRTVTIGVLVDHEGRPSFQRTELEIVKRGDKLLIDSIRRTTVRR